MQHYEKHFRPGFLAGFFPDTSPAKYTSHFILLFTFMMFCTTAGFCQPTVAVADGYAEGTTGGKGGDTVTVTDASSFKTACASGSPKIIIVGKDLGSIGEVRCQSDKTIIGADTTAGFNGNLRLSGARNIIVQNMTFRNPAGIGTGDGIESSACTRIFVTKCTFIDCKDGSFDIKNGSDFLTISWCRFLYPTISGHNLPNLLGHSDNNASRDRGTLHITMHHNWYDEGCDQRMPRVRFGTVHVYNNYYGCKNNTYCIGTGFECKIRVEQCVFDNVNQPWSDINGMANRGEIGWNGLLLIESEEPDYAPNKWPVFTPAYEFTMDSTGIIKEITTDSVYGAGNRLPGRRPLSTADYNQVRQTSMPHYAHMQNRDVHIFDCKGRHVMDMHEADWNNREQSEHLPSGVYFMRNPGTERLQKIRHFR